MSENEKKNRNFDFKSDEFAAIAGHYESALKEQFNGYLLFVSGENENGQRRNAVMCGHKKDRDAFLSSVAEGLKLLEREGFPILQVLEDAFLRISVDKADRSDGKH